MIFLLLAALFVAALLYRERIHAAERKHLLDRFELERKHLLTRIQQPEAAPFIDTVPKKSYTNFDDDEDFWKAKEEETQLEVVS